MLQQTRVSTVIPYYKRFLDVYPTLEDLADAEEDQVLDLWSGMGYYGRARNLLRAAKYIRDNHGGRFPEKYSEAIRLPGIGSYSAAAVLSIAYGQPYAVLDGNVRRFLIRYLAIEEEVKGPVLKGLEALLARIASSEYLADSIGDFNQALMELGAVICVPKDPHCSDCPVSGSCRAFSSGLQRKLPRSRKRSAPQEISFTVTVIEREKRFLMCRNKDEVYLKGFWEFPKVQGQHFGNELVRLLEKNHGLKVSLDRQCDPVIHHITFRRISLYPVVATLLDRPDHVGYQWVRFGEKPYPVSSYIQKVLDRIEPQ
jgi:A/G-specific adenine glycosylase